MAIKSW